jgi:tRNA (guanine10-N2)-dimethyltransferase
MSKNTDRTHTYAFILGSHPELSFAEIQAVLAETAGVVVERAHSAALVESPTELPVPELMVRLGGTIKIVEIVGAFDEDTVSDWLFEHIDEGSKFHFGFSLYALDEGVPVRGDWKTLHALGLAMKRAFKDAGISARFVESREVVLSSVIVHKERLLKNGVEIVLFKRRGGKMLFGHTRSVQPFQDFAKRDFGRPSRDTHSGMLPPKIARIMVNLGRPKNDSVILDPFCGSGTVLQEALLMGFTHVRGSDHSRKAVEDTRRNLEWMKLPSVPLTAERAQDLAASKTMHAHSVDRIVFEGYLGPPSPKPQTIADVQKELNQLYCESFDAFDTLLANDGIIVAALPFWVFGQVEKHLNVARIVSPKFHIQKTFLYKRPQSIVGREIVVLSRAKAFYFN